MNIKKQQKNVVYLISFGLIAVIILVLAFLIIPKIQKIKEISNQVKTQKIELERKYRKGQSLKTAYENLNLVKTNQKQVLSTLISEGDELAFITALEKTASGKNVQQNIDLSPPVPDDKKQIQALNLNIYLEGGFIDILRTINDIEKLSYYIVIDKLDFSSLEKSVLGAKFEDSGSQPVRATLVGKVYWLPVK